MKNEDQWQKRENEIYKQERDKLREIEKERAFLKDKSIGGPNAPRPTDDYIDESLGKPLDRQQITKVAGERAEKKLAQEKADERRQEERAMKQLQQQEKPRRKLSEQNTKIEFKRKIGPSR